MPVPTKESIKAYLVEALVTGTDPFSEPVSGQRRAILKIVDRVPVQGEVPVQIDEFIDALAEGLAKQWLVWQSSQTVLGTATGVSSGSGIAPVTGTLPL